MPVTIAYEYTFNYLMLPTGKRRPGLLTQLRSGSLHLDTKAFLDSGAEYSLFNGEFGSALGLDVIIHKLRHKQPRCTDAISVQILAN